jgi:hypothetical protein
MARTSRAKPKATKKAKGGAAGTVAPEPPMISVRVRMEGVTKLRAANLEAAKAKIQDAFTRGKGVWMNDEAEISFLN